MAIIGEWIRRLGYLLHRRAHEDELRREMEAHRAMPDERDFGNTLRLREEARWRPGETGETVSMRVSTSGFTEPARGYAPRLLESRCCLPSSASTSQAVRGGQTDARVRHPDRDRRTPRALLPAGAAGGGRITAVGFGLGVLLALAAERLLQGFLYGVDAVEPAVLVTAPLILLVSSLPASYVPARRTTKVDPTVALRSE